MSAREDGGGGERGAATVAGMRAEFDGMFAAAPTPTSAAPHTFIAVRIGGDPFALPLAGLLGLHLDHKVVAVPSASLTLIGIAAFRGALTAIHDLRVVLGYTGGGGARWLARVAAAVPVGLAFEAFEGQFASSSWSSSSSSRDGAGAGAAPGFTRGLVRAFDAVRPVIDLPVVCAAVMVGATVGELGGGNSRAAAPPPDPRRGVSDG